MNENVAAIIVAAGSASRYGSDKVLEFIAGKPALLWSVDTFVHMQEFDSVVVVVRSDQRAALSALLTSNPAYAGVSVVTGGRRRQDSVRAGLSAVPDADIAVIHDGARPLVSASIIASALDAIQHGADAAIAAVPVSDTLKRVSAGVTATVDRAGMFRAQTPQAFRLTMLRELLEEAETIGLEVTDEAALFELSGRNVVLIPGDERNLKLTVPADRTILEALMQSSSRQRTGIGYDVHRLIPEGPIVLGGVEIPHTHHLHGHSDADVVLHAICDAILGACALGDIGQHFPPDDEQFRGISSLVLLERVAAIVAAAGFSVTNVDVMVIAESPRIGAYVPAMRDRIAAALLTSVSAVSIKATTNEGLGFAGRQEGIAAMATATVFGQT